MSRYGIAVEAAAAAVSSPSSRYLLTFPADTKTLITSTATTRNRVSIPAPQLSISESTGQYSCPSSCTAIKRNGTKTKGRSRILAISDSTDVSAAAADIDIAKVELTWQIIVGAIAGVTPFVVAGIEFSKRIIAQKRCEVCGGSGLVLRDKDRFRCPGCGGFLPWQSWKRFFTG